MDGNYMCFSKTAVLLFRGGKKSPGISPTKIRRCDLDMSVLSKVRLFSAGIDNGQPWIIERPQRAKMAAPVTDTGEFETWLNDRLDSLEVDRDVYGTYILGVLQEEETDEEKEDALQGILSAFVVIINGGVSQ